MKANHFKVALILSLSFFASSAFSATITWNFTATFDQLSGNEVITQQLISLGIAPGTEISGSLTYDDSQPDVNPTENLGYYFWAITEFSFSSSEFSAVLGQDQLDYRNIAINNGQVDIIDAIADIEFDSMPSFGASAVLRLIDSSGTIFDDTAISNTPFTLSDFDPYDPSLTFPNTTSFYIAVSDGTNHGGAIAQLTSFSFVAVPIPPAVVLLFSAVSMLVFNSRRRDAR